MRKGFRSSRGAMRGTIGGAPICLVGVVGFATVAIGVGPFVYSICPRTLFSFGPGSKTRLREIRLIRWPPSFWYRGTRRGRPGSRNEQARSLLETEWRVSRQHACHTPDRELTDAPQSGPDSLQRTPRVVIQESAGSGTCR